MKLISIIVPIFNEEDLISPFFNKINNVLNSLDYEFEFLFCMDPGNDNTEKEILKLFNSKFKIKLIKFSRRFGQASATLAGFNMAKGDAAIVMDVDLQDPPEIIPSFLDKWEKGYKVVIGQRNIRYGENILKKIIAKYGYKFMNKFSEVPIPLNSGDFRLLDKVVYSKLSEFKESNNFLRGITALIGYKTIIVNFERNPREIGSTKYNKWLGSLKIGFNGIVGFSSFLLSLSAIVGIFISVIALLFAVVYLFYKINGFNFPIGNPTIVILILLMGGFNLMSIGILGLYVSRIYEDVKQRPKFIIEEIAEN